MRIVKEGLVTFANEKCAQAFVNIKIRLKPSNILVHTRVAKQGLNLTSPR